MDLKKVVAEKGGVVVAMPSEIAAKLCSDPRELYSSYEELVGAGLRTPAIPERDRQRYGVVGVLFGGYGAHLRYGVLSLSNQAPASYGEMSARLREIAVRDRVSFLEDNSYFFVAKHKLTPGDAFPSGYRAVWDNRDELVATKLEPKISREMPAQWDEIVLPSDRDRSEDDFVEAHVFGPFNIAAVESLELTSRATLSEDARLFAELAIRRFSRLPQRGSR